MQNDETKPPEALAPAEPESAVPPADGAAHWGPLADVRGSVPASAVPPAGAAPQPAVSPLFGEAVRERRPQPWSGRDLLLFIVFFVAWLLISNFVALAGYSLLKPIMGWHTAASALADNAFFALVAQVIFYVPLFLFILLLVVVCYRQPFWEGIRWFKPTRPGAFQLFFGGVLLAFGVLAGSAFLPDHKPFPLEKLFSSPGSAYALGAFAVLIAPFMEELVFRGVFFSFFEHRAGLAFAVAGTAILFAATHIPEYWGAWSHVLMILVVGVVFSLARGITGSLVPSVILHTAYNATLMSGLFLGTHYFHNLQALIAGV